MNRLEEQIMQNFFENIEPDVLSKVYANPHKFGYSQYLEIIKSRLPDYKINTMLDVGCGEGTPLVNYLKMGYDAEGIDYSNNVLKLAKKNLLDNGYTDSLVSWYDITKQLPDKKYDCINCIGVLPHIVDQELVIQRFSEHLNKDGVMFLQFRNLLFSMFYLNQFTREIFMNELLPRDKLDKIEKDVTKFLDDKLSTTIINIDNIYHHDNNPLEIDNMFKLLGLKIVNKIFAHYHALPPIFEYSHPEQFHELSKDWRECQDWRGNFMCSSFIMEVQKI